MLTPRWRRIKARCPAAVSCNPIDSATRFEQVIDDRIGQALFDSVVSKLVAVESAETVCGAEPEKPSRVGNNAKHIVARQPVGSCVGAHRKLLGRDTTRAKNKRQREARCCEKIRSGNDLSRVLLADDFHCPMMILRSRFGEKEFIAVQVRLGSVRRERSEGMLASRTGVEP